MASSGIAGELTSEEKLEGGEGGPTEPHDRECCSCSKCEGPEVGGHLECSRPSRGPPWPEWGERGGSGLIGHWNTVTFPEPLESSMPRATAQTPVFTDPWELCLGECGTVCLDSMVKWAKCEGSSCPYLLHMGVRWARSHRRDGELVWAGSPGETSGCWRPRGNAWPPKWSVGSRRLNLGSRSVELEEQEV